MSVCRAAPYDVHWRHVRHAWPAPATERDLDALPDDVIGHLVDGELIALPRPDPPHTLEVMRRHEGAWLLVATHLERTERFLQPTEAHELHGRSCVTGDDTSEAPPLDVVVNWP